MNPRRIRAWALRMLVAGGIVLAIFAAPGAGQADEAPAVDPAEDAGVVVVQLEPTWG